MIKLKFMHLINKKIKEQSEEVFEGISKGRKKALENWFKDKWMQLENTCNIIRCFKQNDHKLLEELNEGLNQYKDFCEFFILNDTGQVIQSTCSKHIGLTMNNFPNYEKGLKGERLMYGPYEDKNTLDIDLSQKKFADEVTLLFSLPYIDCSEHKKILLGRVLNDNMSNVIQDEDTHVYKDSGDNYLFMVKTDRDILPGTAISRSRFEDNTFTMGDNLKEGVRTSKWGIVKIKKHTEFEIRFTDPKTGDLHPGVKNTIKNGDNLDCWPGYPDYRHIMVGGKGTLINPPYSNEIWGMMCEGDIAEIYNFKSINLKIPGIISVSAAAATIINIIAYHFNPTIGFISSIITWLLITLISYISSQKLVVTPLNRTVDILHKLAEGEGDLTKRVDKLSYDEIGELSRWFNKFINNQMTLIKRVDVSSKTSKNSIKSVSNLTNNIKENMDTVAKTVDGLVSISQKQNNIFQTTKEHFNSLSASIQEMASLIHQVTNKIVNTSHHADKANDFSNDVLTSINELEETMKVTLDRISVLQNHSNSITRVVTSISSISQQTQLLALNATIEAARAGESGKGFGVVAEQISKLALETEEATQSIGNLVSNIQRETNNTFKDINEINSKVKTSTDSVKNSIDSFKYITDNINDVTKNMETILEITNKESDDINNMVVHINESAEKINKRTAKGASRSEESLSLLEDILSETIRLKEVTDNLEYSSTDLQEMVGSFNTQI
ncbi:methyl-accepting chemotaxis protein [Clostridium sp. WILCCON 0269]|uniref:Methyl-accepting chemotaxis protein n=1 Tax=Candidatus Clostridium eludens TaxID=3381663 RepID=A0ABW8SEB1_9CLOT